MTLLEIELNKYIFLDSYRFKDNKNNIEFLNNLAMECSDPNQQLVFLNQATLKIEKFHSFFHFEQSYFHLQFALELIKLKKLNEAKQQLELAIFQDHKNQQAISILNKISSDADDLNNIIFNFRDLYKRPFESYSKYLNFACEEEMTEGCHHIHWDVALENNLEKLIVDLRSCHLNYHQQSARLYLNRAIIFKKLNLLDLVSNDIRKANNLDSELLNRPDFIKIIPQIAYKVILGLGSNMGDRNFYIKEASRMLLEEKILYHIKSSEIEETEALLKDDSPPEWSKKYLNQVLIGYSLLSPYELLKKIKNLESAIGRTNHLPWAPREIDIDIIDIEGVNISEVDLKIPHPETANRSWIVKALNNFNIDKI